MTTVLAARSRAPVVLNTPVHDRPKCTSTAGVHVTAEWIVVDLAEPGDAALSECSEKLDRYGREPFLLSDE